MGRFIFRLPDLGEGTAEAEIVAWHVAIGDAVEEDQPLVDVMTDKATVEITSPVSGKVVQRRGEPGEMFAVGGTLVEFDTDASPVAADPVVPNPSSQRNVEAREAPPTTPATERTNAPSTAPRSPSPVNGGGEEASVDSPPPPAGEGDQAKPGGGGVAAVPAFFRSDDTKVLTSPAIRRRAREAGVDLREVDGSGPEGRITREDFDSHVVLPEKTESREDIEEIRVIGLRRKIAEKMSLAKRRIPHFAYIEECDVTELEDLRAHLNTTRKTDQPKLTLLPFLITGLTRALARFPQINARYDDEAGIVRRYRAVHLGIATQTPGGLMVPVLRDAQAKDLWTLAGEIVALAQAARSGAIPREALSGSTITLTSLGPLGGLAHTPVINHPEVAIVGPNRIVERPVVRHGQIVVRKMMNISASFDHRVVDGYDAAEFIQSVKGFLEYPATLFIGS